MICIHGLPFGLCVMCRSMGAAVYSQHQQQTPSSTSYNEEFNRKAQQQERERQQELKREAERQLELRRQEVLSQCKTLAENGKFLEAWSTIRNSNINWYGQVSSPIKYNLAEAILLDVQFFNEEITTVSQFDKISLILCLLDECASQDVAQHLLRRTLSLAHGHDGASLSAISEFLGTNCVVSANNDKNSADAITYKELVLNFSLDFDKTYKERAKDFCAISKEFENYRSNLFKKIDSLAYIVKKFPEIKSMQEAINAHQKVLEEEKKREQAEKLRREEAEACRRAEEERRRQALLKRLAEEKELARIEAEQAKQIEIDRIDQTIVRALKGIENYQALPRSIFNSHLGFFTALFDNSRGLSRANTYHHLLSSQKYTRVQKGIILLVLLLGDNPEKELKNQVLKLISDGDIKYLEGYVVDHYPRTKSNLRELINHLMVMADSDTPVMEERAGNIFNSFHL